MEQKDFFEVEELEQDLKNIKQDMELLRDYSNLAKKVRELKNKGK